ncbi:MAG: CHAD domain-containing protein [Sulfurospirillaceae bacterium]|nr:CHAD domain-containing protein [Sulfurospirillaceae bacterium]
MGSSKRESETYDNVASFLKNNLKRNLLESKFQLQNFLRTKHPENLHQYRVAIRSSRSIFREFSKFCDDKRYKIVNAIMKTLQRETNHIRDLDVFLECIQTYKKIQKKEYFENFQTMQDKLQKKRDNCFLEFRNEIKTLQHNEAFSAIIELQEHEHFFLPKAKDNLEKHIQKILQKRISKIAKISKKLNVNSQNELFHILRLNYKKVRYTIDALLTENKEEKLKRLSQSIKTVQTSFGEVQDKHTQLMLIEKYTHKQSECFENIINILKEELAIGKQKCVEHSQKSDIEAIKKEIKELF